MSIQIRIASPADEPLFDTALPGVFDNAVRPDALRAFLASPAHHIAIALEDKSIVGMVSANEYLHPDKPTQVWINEVAVAPTHRRRAIGKRLLDAMLRHLRERGFDRAWLATEHDNSPARALFRAPPGVNETEGVVLFEYDLRSSAD